MNDKDIIQLYLNRDQLRHYLQLGKEVWEILHFYCKNILGNNEDAEENVNDTYLNMELYTANYTNNSICVPWEKNHKKFSF